MSSSEIVHQLKKLVGKFERIEGIKVYNTAMDHQFVPSIEVYDKQIEIPIQGFLYSIKVDHESAPCKFNLDRPITNREYSVVFPGTIKTISRFASKLYLQAPSNQVSKVTIEALKLE